MKHPIRLRPARLQDLYPSFKMIMSTMNHLRTTRGFEKIKVTFRELPPIPKHLYETDSDLIWCAVSDDKIVGYAHALIRGKQWYLAYLFVSPKVQDKGVGRKLLEKVWREERGMTHSLCTFGYNPQAIGIYSQFGMAPVDGIPMLSARVGNIRKPDRPGLLLSDQLTSKDIAWINRLEGEVRGYKRAVEWEFWTTDPNFKPFVFRDNGQRVGYAAVYKDVMIGPIGAVSTQYLVKATAELLNLLPADKDLQIKINPAGSNLTLYQMLISCGFRIDELAVFMSDSAYPDLSRYVPTHLAIF